MASNKFRLDTTRCALCHVEVVYRPLHDDPLEWYHRGHGVSYRDGYTDLGFAIRRGEEFDTQYGRFRAGIQPDGARVLFLHEDCMTISKRILSEGIQECHIDVLSMPLIQEYSDGPDAVALANPLDWEVGRLPSLPFRTESPVIRLLADSTDPFQRLPSELHLVLASFLSVRDISSLRVASRAAALQQFTSSFWRERTEQDIPYFIFFHDRVEVHSQASYQWMRHLRDSGTKRSNLSNLWRICNAAIGVKDLATHRHDLGPTGSVTISPDFKKIQVWSYPYRQMSVLTGIEIIDKDKRTLGYKTPRSESSWLHRDIKCPATLSLRRIQGALVQLGLGKMKHRDRSSEIYGAGYCEIVLSSAFDLKFVSDDMKLDCQMLSTNSPISQSGLPMRYPYQTLVGDVPQLNFWYPSAPSGNSELNYAAFVRQDRAHSSVQDVVCIEFCSELDIQGYIIQINAFIVGPNFPLCGLEFVYNTGGSKRIGSCHGTCVCEVFDGGAGETITWIETRVHPEMGVFHLRFGTNYHRIIDFTTGFDAKDALVFNWARADGSHIPVGIYMTVHRESQYLFRGYTFFKTFGVWTRPMDLPLVCGRQLRKIPMEPPEELTTRVAMSYWTAVSEAVEWYGVTSATITKTPERVTGIKLHYSPADLDVILGRWDHTLDLQTFLALDPLQLRCRYGITSGGVHQRGILKELMVCIPVEGNHSSLQQLDRLAVSNGQVLLWVHNRRFDKLAISG